MKKTKFIILLLFLLVLVGIVLISYAQFKKETIKDYKQIKESGRSLIGMLSLPSTASLLSGPNDYFFRELSQNAISNKIAYCIIHDAQRKPVLLFSPENIDQQVPDIIINKSLLESGFIMQDFLTTDGHELIEFAKPVFADKKIAAVVRLGLKVADNNFFTYENLVLPFQIAFFIMLALVFGYYWTILSFKHLKTIKLADDGTPGIKPGKGDVKDIIENLEAYLASVKEKTSEAETQRQQLESRLKISQFENKQFFNIFNAFDFGILLIDNREMVFFANTYLLNLLGQSAEDLINSSYDEVIEHEDLKTFIMQRGSAEGHLISKHMKITFEKTDPGQFFQASSYNITDAEGSLFIRLIMVVNISREKEAEKAQQDFISHIAHELRTPLTNIKAYNEMMMDGEINNAEMQKEFFNTINDETNRLAKLISSILELAESEMGQLTITKDMVKTDWLMEGCIEAVEAVAKEKNITIERQVPDNFPKVMGDKEMLKSALINILGNAVKYSPESARITFAIKEADDMVVFEINDTGYGMDEKDLPHIFEKFYRSENEDVVEQTGSGLGLAITAEIIKTHDGFIEVQSELDKGSQFTIKIPKGDLLIG
ncbi:MAG: PAS domain-containing protein [Deltaproteobacteria bacterium]|uniref:sensor histidine kinase n=1 Tax=Desulfobacula sp. TaxID=2593537 RepID=UPI0019C92358|nr:PAS domain-containing protein [Candidatus Desulfobacula maris]MBL6993197.1 PAS domain-containing protein [Desulfobacula sp.]